MSDERHETVADNVSVKHQFREVAKMMPHEEVDVSKMETTAPTREKSSAVGNSAKMREALEQIRELLSIGGKPDTAMCIRYEAAYQIAKEALSDKPRNCDKYTLEEAFRKYGSPTKGHPWEEIEWRYFCEWLFSEAKGDKK